VASSAERVALVTGASSGIGAGVVRALSAHGVEVHALARRQDRLRNLARETGCVPHTIDLRDSAAIESLLAAIPADILVNNAGVSLDRGPLHEAEPADINEMVETNFLAGLYVMRSAVAGMVARGRGHVVIVGSIAGLYPMPGSSVYSATKAAMHALSDAMRCDLLGKAVRVTEIAAGRVDSEIFDRKAAGSDEAARQYFAGRKVLRPVDIAGAVLYAIDAPVQVNVSRIEILPITQAVGGIRFAKPAGGAVHGPKGNRNDLR
jgi:NADP-dependent 3-hydroxy acid dehydrogenase YdfG